jgi:hypothetical protein
MTTAPGLGEKAGNATLPSGLTLLDSDQEQCDGTVQIGQATFEDDGDGLQAEFFVEPGQNATFELEDGEEDIAWACTGGGSPEVKRMSCPRGATHVRITRATSGGDLLVECYGR